MGDDLARLGEREVIRRLLARVPATGEGVVVGPGDDAAVLDVRGRLVASADALVEGSHFDLALSSPADVGYKALTVNVSDLAAMGARPRWALLALGAELEMPADDLDALAAGLGAAAREHGVAVVGGDTVGAPQLVVAVAVLGTLDGEPLRRSGARPGDLLCVTGTVGAAAAGLALMRVADPGARSLLDRYPALAAAHRRGRARVIEGQAAATGGARAAIDISDGVAMDASRLAEASGVGLEVVAPDVPLAAGVAEVAAWLGEEPWHLGAGGGDDYELLLAVGPLDLERLRAAVAPTPLISIGRFGGDDRVLVTPRGDRLPLDELGWEHFRP